MTDAPSSFPTDLLDAQREMHEIRSALHTLQNRLPWSREPHDGMEIKGWKPFSRPATSGWPAEDAAEFDRLREREHELASFIVAHRFFADFDGPEAVAKRSLLKHEAAAQPVVNADDPEFSEAA
ncbi:hypothetical protein ACOKM5_44055 [Streptomyces sp. BH097]|uniref:hypothetical protein n=1 Tax=unclassified Streptomyces TaxID=2593676 RepID=UPI003BB6DD01